MFRVFLLNAAQLL